MKRKDENLRGELLRCAQSIADTDGYEKISIRALAEQAGIAAGTVYNYFSSKDEILLAMTDEYWSKALEEMGGVIADAPFFEQLEQIYQYLCKALQSSVGTLMNSLGGVREAGAQRMLSMHTVMHKMLLCYLEKDGAVREDAWTDSFTRERFLEFVIANMMLSLRMRAKDIDFLVDVVRRAIY